MISTLVIGGKPLPGEVSLLDGGHPHSLRSRIRDLHDAREGIVIHTWSPLVIHEVTSCWIGDSESGWLERVFFRLSTGSDVHLVAVRAPEWLAHFALEDLYMHGEFDDLLADPTDPPMTDEKVLIETSPEVGDFRAHPDAGKWRCGQCDRKWLPLRKIRGKLPCCPGCSEECDVFPADDGGWEQADLERSSRSNDLMLDFIDDEL